MNWATLGSVVFNLLNSPEQVTSSFGQDYAQHPVIQGKPRLQAIGTKLAEVNFTISLNGSFGDNPEAVFSDLKDLADEQEPVLFMIGTGEYAIPWQGLYVITELKPTIIRALANGGIMAMTVDVALLEWVPDEVVQVSRNTNPVVAASGTTGAQQGEPEHQTPTTDPAATAVPSDVTRVPAPPMEA